MLLLHAMWIGSVGACVMKNMPEQGSAMQNMPGMQMAAAHSQTDEIAALPVSASAPQDEPAHCQFPWSSNDCHSMAPCTPLAITAEKQAVDSVTEVPARAEVRRVLMPPTRVRTPEPPPPRA